MATITSPRAVSPNPSRITSPPPQAGADTPTSSVRTSLDGHSVTGSSSNLSTPTVTAPPNQRRNRAALRDYYNIKAKPTATSPSRQSTDSVSTLASSNATLTNTKQDESTSISLPQLDDPNFNADQYVDELLRTSSLRDILRAESTLVSEIRNYDGERKALVYDNYSKLIKAVSTIGDMQKGMTQRGGNQPGNSIDGIKALDGKLDKLMNVVKDIQGVKSQSEITHAEERKQVRAQKRKQELVRWVVAAPERLRNMVGEGKKQEAEAEWTQVQELLGSWKGVQGVQQIQTACEQIMDPDKHEISSSDEAE